MSPRAETDHEGAPVAQLQVDDLPLRAGERIASSRPQFHANAERESGAPARPTAAPNLLERRSLAKTAASRSNPMLSEAETRRGPGRQDPTFVFLPRLNRWSPS
jgi:hypothetical protein